jgi:uncharacterized membrane protein
VRSLQVAALVAAAVTVGLMAGLFAAFAYAVMPGLRRVDDRAFVAAMQQINVAIINPWFLACFLGGLLFTALAGVLHLDEGSRSALPWIAAGFVLYAAALAITGRVNVPLNNALAAAGDTEKITDVGSVRRQFEARWVRWNVVRAVTSTAAFGCLAWALVRHGAAVA